MFPLGLANALQLCKGTTLPLPHTLRSFHCIFTLSVPESLLDGGINEIHMKLQHSFLHLQFSSTNSLELVKEQWSSYREQCLDYLNATAPAAGEALSSRREFVSALNASRRKKQA